MSKQRSMGQALESGAAMQVRDGAAVSLQAIRPPMAVPVRETWLRITRKDYLTYSLEQVETEDGKVVSRKTLEPPDIPRVTLAKAYAQLEKMAGDR